MPQNPFKHNPFKSPGKSAKSFGNFIGGTSKNVVKGVGKGLKSVTSAISTPLMIMLGAGAVGLLVLLMVMN